MLYLLFSGNHHKTDNLINKSIRLLRLTLKWLFIGNEIDKINLIAYSTLYGNYDWYCCRHLDCKRRLPAISHTNLQLLWRNEEKNFLCSYCSRHSFLSFNFLFIVGLLKMEFILIIEENKDLSNVYYQYNYIIRYQYLKNI